MEEHLTEKSDDEDDHYPTITPNASEFFYFISAKGSIVASNEPLPALRSELLARVKNWQTQQTEMVSFILPDGKKVRLMLAGLPVHDDRTFVGMVFVGKDLSTYDHFLDRLLQSLLGSSLILLLSAALAGQFAAAKALIPIKQSFETQRQFVTDASHELRTPLSVIQASLDVLDQQDGAHLSGLSSQILADLKVEVRRMARLVGNLLTLARADSGVLEILKEHFDLRSLAELVIRSLINLANQNSITIHLSGPDTIPIYADKDRLAQLLYILLENGIKYTPQGGTITVNINPSTSKKTQGITIIIQDTGIGLTPEDREQIFKRFYRVDKSRSRDVTGFGLGLSIAAWIVAVHGGTIDVKSESGVGSTFTVFIPG
jgi:signal transduction histidine kinase